MDEHVLLEVVFQLPWIMIQNDASDGTTQPCVNDAGDYLKRPNVFEVSYLALISFHFTILTLLITHPPTTRNPKLKRSLLPRVCLHSPFPPPRAFLGWCFSWFEIVLCWHGFLGEVVSEPHMRCWS